MRIFNNVSALMAQGRLTSTTEMQNRSIKKLSSGLRINSAADDAAGLAISSKIQAQIRGTDQAVRNSQDGISMIGTAEGAINESLSILQRMRELSVKAANDTLTSGDRQFIQVEIDQLKDELDRIATTTQFNKKRLLDGSADVLWSTNVIGTRVKVRGNLLERDGFKQTIKKDGNYSLDISVRSSGQNQVLKSNIFNVAMDDDGTIITLGQVENSLDMNSFLATPTQPATAGKDTKLCNVANFADNNGRFLLANPQEITVSLENGGSKTITIYGSDTLGDLGDKLSNAITIAAGTNASAPAQFVGKRSVLPDMDNAILNGLAKYWLDGAGKRILEGYGLTGNGKNLQIKLVPDLGGPLAAASWSSTDPNVVVISISETDFLPANLPNGTNPHGSLYDDRIIAHELVHAVMFADDNLRESQFAADGSGLWLVEGLTEYIHGANRRVQTDNLADINSAIGTIVNAGAFDYNLYSNAGTYSAAYLAVRYFDERSLANGGTGIKGLLNELKNNSGPYDNARMDTAIGVASNGYFASRGALATALATDGAFIDGVRLENEPTDTGAIGGSYASGGAPLSPENIIGGNGLYSLNPLASYGWTGVTWPSSGGGGGAGMVTFMNTTGSGVLTTSTVSPMQGTLQSVEGTLLLHSSITGKAGKISITGEEDILKALGFAEIQSPEETVYSATLRESHSGRTIESSIYFTGHTMIGAIHPNIDIELPKNFALNAIWSKSEYGTYSFFNKPESLNVHLVSNATVLQIGSNQGEYLALSFGDVSSHALGVEDIRITSQEQASSSITAIDNAISRLSSVRSRLGSFQNRLEHTVSNLTVASVNLTASESRIRDLDMAREMMNFTKLNILTQTASSMLAQANQLPQSILQLLT